MSRGLKRPLRRTGPRWDGDFKVDLVEVMCVKWPTGSGLVFTLECLAVMSFAVLTRIS